MKKSVKILSTAKYADRYVITVLYTENEKDIKYKYCITPSSPLERILRKKVFTFKDLNFIKKNGRLLERI